MPKLQDVHVGTVTFYSLFNQENKLDIPMFQRDYSWEDEELTKFWDDLEKTMEVSGLEQFMGQIVFGNTQPLATLASGVLKYFYDIIDGQQRITTATIFLCALRDVAYENNLKELAKEIQRYITTSSGPPSQDIDFIVTLGYSDRDFFRDFIQFDSQDRRKKKESDYVKTKSVGETRLSNELIYKAYRFFIGKIEDNSKNYTSLDKVNYLTRLKDRFLRNYFFISVRLPNITEGSQIFETMNAYGERLEATDLVKNLIFLQRQSQGVTISNLESELIDWNDSIAKLKDGNPSRFLRHYWLSKYRDTDDPVTIENLYKIFKTKAENDPAFAGQLLNDIREYADIYMVLNEPTNYGTFAENERAREKAEEALNGLGAMNASRAFPLLMSTFKNFPNQFPRMCRLIEILVFRYSLICNLDAKRLEKTFNEISVSFENVDKGNQTIARRLFEDKIKLLKNRIPSKDQFESSFRFKSSWTNKAARYVLSRIELSKGTGETLLNSKTLSLEHIFPKSPSDECSNEVGDDLSNILPKTNSIGNFTLILGRWNHKMSNKPFSFKKETYYKKSDIKITKELSEINSWNSTEVENRCVDFCKKCATLWDPNTV